KANMSFFNVRAVKFKRSLIRPQYIAHSIGLKTLYS
ncbi:MAG: hypothetical protein ACI84K_000736, partial [Pseudohongiellaceae bacterium]